MIQIEKTADGALKMPSKKSITVGRAYELLRADVLSHLERVQRKIGYDWCRFHGIFHDEMEVVARRPNDRLAFSWHAGGQYLWRPTATGTLTLYRTGTDAARVGFGQRRAASRFSTSR